MRIGVLGGSFDPVHLGHLLAAQALQERLGLDEVRLIPAGRQPFKPEGHGASADHRAAMLELAVAGAPGLVADRIEVDRPGPSYTVDTLRALHARHPGDDLVLLVGSDAARSLPAWHEAEAIPGLAQVVVFARGGQAALAGAEVVPQVEISSTAVRERVRTGRSLRYWVPDAVAGYIATHRLYRDGES